MLGMLYDLMRHNPQADPLSPENPLIFGCGPLVGTPFPCASRFTVTAKSPLTGIFGDSNAGGWFPVRLKQAGYDHIVIAEGRNVRAPQDRVLGNSQSWQQEGKCHRKQTAPSVSPPG